MDIRRQHACQPAVVASPATTIASQEMLGLAVCACATAYGSRVTRLNRCELEVVQRDLNSEMLPAESNITYTVQITPIKWSCVCVTNGILSAFNIFQSINLFQNTQHEKTKS